MRHLAKSVAVLLAGFASAAIAPPPPEDISPVRIAAIVKCIKVAHARYPDDNDAQQRSLYLAYKECMTGAGEIP
jgi:hypothetical protein